MIDNWCSSSSSRPSVRPVGEMSQASYGLHQSAAPGAGKPVQTQQVLVQTQALWGGHVPDADWDAGKTASSIRRLGFWAPRVSGWKSSNANTLKGSRSRLLHAIALNVDTWIFVAKSQDFPAISNGLFWPVTATRTFKQSNCKTKWIYSFKNKIYILFLP